jgi:hypothetical protein
LWMNAINGGIITNFWTSKYASFRSMRGIGAACLWVASDRSTRAFWTMVAGPNGGVCFRTILSTDHFVR